MNLRTHLGLAFMLFAASLLHSQEAPDSAQSGSTISVSVNLVKVPVSVFDESGAMVRDLRSSDFRLYENGVSQDIRSFGLDRNAVSVVLLIDTSGSVKKELKKIKEAAENFAMALSPEDKISVITFADEVEMVLDWTENKRLVRKALGKLEEGFRTALYDAMFIAAYEQLKDMEGRKAIILLTDALNNQSTIGFEDAALSVIQSQASLYVVSKTVMARQAAKTQRRVIMLSEIYRKKFGVEDYIDEFFRKKEEQMTDLAEKTGGRAFFPRDYEEIKEVYGQVAKELKSKYYLTYISNREKNPDTFQTISLEYLPPHGKMSYRQGYYHEPRTVHKRRTVP